jgi:hypothetical protein
MFRLDFLFLRLIFSGTLGILWMLSVMESVFAYFRVMVERLWGKVAVLISTISFGGVARGGNRNLEAGTAKQHASRFSDEPSLFCCL